MRREAYWFSDTYEYNVYTIYIMYISIPYEYMTTNSMCICINLSNKSNKHICYA